MLEFLPIIMFLVVCGALMLGYPVAFTLAGTALLFAAVASLLGELDIQLLLLYPDRIYNGTLTNTTLIAVPLFVFMGVMLEKSKIAEQLLEKMGHACARLPAGLGLAVIVVGVLMAASTGIVGATVVTMGLMSLPTMLKRGYDPALAAGTICATGTLGQIIPPPLRWCFWEMFSPVPISKHNSHKGYLTPNLFPSATFLWGHCCLVCSWFCCTWSI